MGVGRSGIAAFFRCTAEIMGPPDQPAADRRMTKKRKA
jgi:hypothetical protein